MWFNNPFKKKPVVCDDGFPNQDWVREHPVPSFTNDMTKLEDSEWKYLFVYNHMMRGHRAYDFTLKDYVKYDRAIGVAYTKSTRLVMYKKRLGLGTFPIVLTETRPRRNLAGKSLEGRIKGELYLVKSSRYEELDNYMLNGVEFRRKRVKLLFAYRHQLGRSGAAAEELIKEVEAYMYVGRQTYWREHIDAGHMFPRVQMYEPNTRYSDGLLMGNYFAFTTNEYNDS